MTQAPKQTTQATAQTSAQTTGNRTFKKQLQAVRFLQSLGYKIEKSKFNRDFKAGKIPLAAEGTFEENLLRSYAAVELTSLDQYARQEAIENAVDKNAAETRLKNIQADRFALKLEKERGHLMRREEYETALAARALFFRREIESFIHLHGAALIHLVGGDENRLAKLTAWYLDKTAAWMDAWSQEREFTAQSDLDDDFADDAADENQDSAAPMTSLFETEQPDGN